MFLIFFFSKKKNNFYHFNIKKNNKNNIKNTPKVYKKTHLRSPKTPFICKYKFLANRFAKGELKKQRKHT